MQLRLEVLGFETPIPIPNGEWFDALFDMLLLRFSFIIDNYEMVHYIMLLPIAVMGLISLAMLGIGIIRGNIAWS